MALIRFGGLIRVATFFKVSSEPLTENTTDVSNETLSKTLTEEME